MGFYHMATLAGSVLTHYIGLELTVNVGSQAFLSHMGIQIHGDGYVFRAPLPKPPGMGEVFPQGCRKILCDTDVFKQRLLAAS